MNFKDFAYMNRHRSESPAGFNLPMNKWTLSDWFTELTGELGEAANVCKKLNRARVCARGNTASIDELRSALADEIADTFICLDMLAQSQGIDLESAVIAKFNKTSKKIGYPDVLQDTRPRTIPMQFAERDIG
jgi:NTP pyrophosphatase (non-canonical NTP hydrolase)